MTRVRSAEAKSIAVPPKATTSPPAVADMKARQLAKIQDLGQALIDAGFRMLDEQADALGLARSTAWTILKARHKSSGLSAMIIERMLGSTLPAPLCQGEMEECASVAQVRRSSPELRRVTSTTSDENPADTEGTC